MYTLVFNTPSGWFLFYFVTLVLFLCLLAIIPHFKQLQLKNKKAVFYNKGVESNLELIFLRKWSVPGLGVRIEIFPKSYKDAFTDIRVHFVSTHNKESIVFEWMPMKRGVYNDLSFTVITSDFFKLFSKITTLKLETPLYILPKEVPHKIEKLYLDIFKINRLPDHQRALEVKKFRTYQDGDSWRLIDWKLSARNREPIIKEFELEKETKFQLIFLGEASPKFETMLSYYYTFQKRLRNQVDIEQILIGKEGSFSYSNSEEIFAWLSPYQEIPQDLTKLEVVKDKIVIIFLTLNQKQTPAFIKSLEKRNIVYYVRLFNQELVLQKSAK